MVNNRADQPEPTVGAGGVLLRAQAAGRAVLVGAGRRMVVWGWAVLKA